MTAPNSAIAASSPYIAHQRVVFLARIIRERAVRGSALHQRDGAVLQIRQGAAVDDCENIRKRWRRSWGDEFGIRVYATYIALNINSCPILLRHPKYNLKGV